MRAAVWQVDRSRYEAGFNCPWRRLLGYHVNYTGLTSKYANHNLATGILVHKALEHYCRTRQVEIPQVAGTEGTETWESAALLFAQDVVEALTWGWVRTVWPWLDGEFEIVAVEQEMNLDLPHPDLPLRWMARPDLIARSKKTGMLTVHDFKSTSSWKDSYLTEWGDSLQLMMNAHTAAQHYGEAINHYYVHFLVKGTQEWPTSLTHAYHRAANPPLEAEDWRLKKPYGRSGQFYDKIAVSTKRPLRGWIDSLSGEVLSKYFIIGGPFTVNPYKVRLFTEGLFANEWWWKESLGAAISESLTEIGKDWDLDNPGFRLLLSRFFPRTFDCYTYNSRCSYYDLCLKPETKWQDKYILRTPHHPQEVI